MMVTLRCLFVFVLALLLAAIVPVAAWAATYELSPTMKTAFDKMAADDGKLRGKLTEQYSEIIALQQKDVDAEAAIKSLHYRNEEAETIIRKQIKSIDADKLDKLKKDVEQTKARYKPLLDAYTAVNKQVAAARSLKNKDLSAIFRMQAESMKIAVQLAKQDMKGKEAALKKAKDAASSAQKKISALLEDIRPHETKIKAEKSAASNVKKSVASGWKSFTPLVKAGSAKPASDSLANLVSQFRQIVSHKQNILNLERKIESILMKAKAQLPSS